MIASAGPYPFAAVANAMHKSLGPDRLVVAGPHEQEITEKVCARLAEGRCAYCDGEHWEDAEHGGRCINCGRSHPNIGIVG